MSLERLSQGFIQPPKQWWGLKLLGEVATSYSSLMP